MAHIALFTIPAHGHVLPMLPIAAELVRRGHRVTLATTAPFAALAATTGAEVLPYASSLTPKPGSGDPPADFAAWLPLVLVLESTTTLPHFLQSFQGDEPDLLLYDRTIYATGRVLAERWQRPAVELFVSFASNEKWSLNAVAAGLDEHPARVAFREKLAELDPGITPADFLLARPESALALLPREFQWAGETFDDRFAFVGPCVGDRSFQGDWQPPAGDAPIVYVSLGTAVNDRPELFRAAIRAVTGTPWHAVVSTGGLEPELLGELPPNVEVHASVPQQAVLRHAAVFVTHAGMGSTMEALAQGVPMVALPHSLEQAAVARRIADLGLGLDLGSGLSPESTADVLQEAIDTVHRSVAIRAAVHEMAAAVRGAGGVSRAADELERRLRTAADRPPAAPPGAGS